MKRSKAARPFSSERPWQAVDSPAGFWYTLLKYSKEKPGSEGERMKKEILFQLDIAWQLFEYHCEGLGEEEALWCKSETGLQVRKTGDGWSADWPSTEAYHIGPPSIAWTVWHILYWWNTTLIASKEGRVIEKEEVQWPGSLEAALREVRRCHEEWLEWIGSLSEEELLSTEPCRWPFAEHSVAELALWLNGEFMKNTAEIGMGRFLYASEAAPLRDEAGG